MDSCCYHHASRGEGIHSDRRRMRSSLRIQQHKQPRLLRVVVGIMTMLLLLQTTTTTITTKNFLVEARAILGVDMGSLYMKVALVQSGHPIEIVTNLHSKRKTEQMILFDQLQRGYGADAAALLQRKAHLTPTAMSLMLGRTEQHPFVKVSIVVCVCACVYRDLSYVRSKYQRHSHAH